MHLVMRDKTGTSSRLCSSPVIKGTTWCWQLRSWWVTPGPDTPDRPPARRHVGERKKYGCTKAYLVAHCSFGDWLFFRSVISGELFYHSSVYCELTWCLLYVVRQKANDRTWREPDGSTRTLMTGCVVPHKHTLQWHVDHCIETLDPLNNWPPESHFFFFIFS